MAIDQGIRLLILLCLCGAGWSARAETVPYPWSGSVGDTRDVYPLKLLQLALDKAGTTQYSLRPTDIPMLQGRALAELAHGSRIRVGWGMTSIERESALLPIRVPIFKGLVGWRLALVRKDRTDSLAAVQDLTSLRRFVAGQGHDWPDTEIMRSNGVRVVGVPLYDSLFRMLASARFDYFPRSVPEIWAEAEQYRKLGIVIDPHLLVRYPTAFYFFVNKNDTALADTLRSGLEQAVADGSFDRLFCAHYGQLIAQARLEHRQVVELNNPILPPETPLARKELWFRIGMCATGK
ncbi:amino acid ABC transporter substrate-binding protein [Chitinimonas arctica]|uniref:Amino acid ABC transporter substrate-binding protein n=1 Tax=Chitinimonas arctica TaxID=2594795 RepID=A0A516SJP6_9NEIS|nr:transporter substrate-binding domain-containing protein [Chitinimonas arctica]QDQ28366.1 amino acid ABC transporter substrate-binding protein [Chitinimonas arctica]